MGKGVTVAPHRYRRRCRSDSLSGRIIAFQDFVNEQDEPYDDNGHGTHCASLIAGGLGMGWHRSESGGGQVMDRNGACYLSDALKALDWCLENRDRYG